MVAAVGTVVAVVVALAVRWLDTQRRLAGAFLWYFTLVEDEWSLFDHRHPSSKMTEENSCLLPLVYFRRSLEKTRSEAEEE